MRPDQSGVARVQREAHIGLVEGRHFDAAHLPRLEASGASNQGVAQVIRQIAEVELAAAACVGQARGARAGNQQHHSVADALIVRGVDHISVKSS
jgi:hypothetical protein